MIHFLTSVDLRLVPGVLRFAEKHQAAIKTHWAKCVAKTPALWDGKVLATLKPKVEAGCLSASLVEMNFSTFLAWRDWGCPDATIFNLFGSAIIRSREGDLIFGRMGQNTSNPGAIYPPGGSLEPKDVIADQRVDVFASISRELKEETGLDASEAVAEDDFVAWDAQLISVNRVLKFDRSTKELVDKIREFLAAEDDPELADIVAFSAMSDIDWAPIRPYAFMSAKHLLG